MKYLIQILVGYLLAVPLTNKVEINLANTQWDSIITYVWIVSSIVVWWLIVMAVAFSITVIATILEK